MIVTVPVSDIPADKPKAVVVNEQLTLAVCRMEDGFHAVDNKCPHRGAPLAQGAVTGNLLVCPLHHFRFDLKSGRCVMPKHLKVRAFPVTRAVTPEGDMLNIEVEMAAAAPVAAAPAP